VACEALPEAARLFTRAGDKDQSLAALERAFKSCPQLEPETLLALANERLARGDRAGAAAAFEAIDRSYPLEPEAQSARARLSALADALPPRSPSERARALLERGGKLLDAGRTTEALALLRTIPLTYLTADEADLARVRLGRALLTRGRRTEGRALLQKIEAGSPQAAEAAYRLAADSARRTGTPEAYIPVADRFRGTPWGEEALLALANHFQKDALDDSASPWWRRLLAEYPDGRYAERAAWRAGWSEFHAGRFQAAADTFEPTARRRPPRKRDGRAALLVGTRAARARRDRSGARSLRGDDPALQARLPRRARAGRARAPRRQRSDSGGRIRRRPAAAVAARAARQPGPAAAPDRPARRGGRRAASPAGGPARHRHARLGRVAARPLPARHRRDEARLPGVGRRSGRPFAAGGLAGALPDPLRARAHDRRARGRPRSPRSSPR
jgi:TolA-binding protein